MKHMNFNMEDISMKRVLFFFVTTIVLASCVKEDPTTGNNWGDGEHVVNITAGAPSSKTQLIDETKVHWNPDDKIKMCFEAKTWNKGLILTGTEFENLSNEISESASFIGSVDASKFGDYGFVVYPTSFKFDSRTSGNWGETTTTTISHILPSVQPAAENTFAPNLNLSYASVTNKQVQSNIENNTPINVTFNNMCALIKVCLPAQEHNIKDILIESANPLTGEYSMLWEVTSNKQTLKLNGFKTEVKEVTIANEDGSNLTPAASYYAVVWPGQHSGLTLTFTDANGLVCVKNLNKTVNCEVAKITEINVKNLEFKEAEPELTVSTSAMNFVADGGYNTFTFNTNKDWTATVTSNQAWCTIDKKSGVAGNNTIGVTCSAHTNYKNTRSADITISAGNLTHTIKVTQDAAKKVVSLEVNTTSLSVAGQGGTASFTVTCNDNWTITDIPDWLTFSTTSGTESSSAVTVNVTAKQNFFYNTKNQSVAIKAGDAVKYIAFRQPGVTSFTIGDVVSKAEDIQNGQAYIIRNHNNVDYYWQTPTTGTKLQYTTWKEGIMSITHGFIYHRDDSKGKSSDNRYNSVSTGAWQSCYTGAFISSNFEIGSKDITSAVYIANSNRWGSDEGEDIDMCQIGSTTSISYNGGYYWGDTGASNRKWRVYKAIPQY